MRGDGGVGNITWLSARIATCPIGSRQPGWTGGGKRGVDYRLRVGRFGFRKPAALAPARGCRQSRILASLAHQMIEQVIHMLSPITPVLNVLW